MGIEKDLRGKTAPNSISSVVVGTFDGVHVGHRRLLRAATEANNRMGAGTAIAITFRQQPKAVINTDLTSTYLSTLPERLDLLRGLGMDLVIPIDFDDSVRLLTARDFTSLLKKYLGMSVLVLGPYASIGHDQVRGNAALRRLAQDGGFDLLLIEGENREGAQVSSSAIRLALETTHIDTVTAMLGRRYSLRGTVIYGDQRGRSLGFPTANLEVPVDIALPGDGIYATLVHTDRACYEAATSIGFRPTFGGRRRVIEAYLLDFEGDLYGKHLRLEFVKHLRNEEKFSTIHDLTRQMRQDVAQTKRALADLTEVGL